MCSDSQKCAAQLGIIASIINTQLEKISAKGANNSKHKLDREKLGKLRKNASTRMFVNSSIFLKCCCRYDTKMSMPLNFLEVQHHSIFYANR